MLYFDPPRNIITTKITSKHSERFQCFRRPKTFAAKIWVQCLFTFSFWDPNLNYRSFYLSFSTRFVVPRFVQPFAANLFLRCFGFLEFWDHLSRVGTLFNLQFGSGDASYLRTRVTKQVNRMPGINVLNREQTHTNVRTLISPWFGVKQKRTLQKYAEETQCNILLSTQVNELLVLIYFVLVCSAVDVSQLK